MNEQERKRVEERLGDAVICECGARLDDYADKCEVALGAVCPGFLAIEAAATVGSAAGNPLANAAGQVTFESIHGFMRRMNHRN